MNKIERQWIIRENTKGPIVVSDSINRQKRRSMFIRHLDCGSCNGCEMELNALNNPIYDLMQYGIKFESSPRHADIIAMTGCFTRALKSPAQATVEAMPIPRIITIGDCAKDGGVFKETYAVIERPPEMERLIMAHVPGCPPSPGSILQVLLEISLKLKGGLR